MPPQEIAGPADPTGAGDMFSAGCLTARIEGDAPLEAAQRAADAVPDFPSAGAAPSQES